MPRWFAAIVVLAVLPFSLAARLLAERREVGPDGRNIVRLSLTAAWMNADPLNYPRPLIGVNGRFPSPTIRVTQGDRLLINVTNHLSEGTAVHWHGIHHRDGTNDMDGVPHVTQQLIEPNGTMLYNFTVDQAGSYWYHAHNHAQLTDGLRGAFIVEENNTKQSRDDLVLLLGDWYHGKAVDLLTDDFLIPESEGAEPVPNGALFNGIGQRSCRALPGGGNSGGKGACPYTRLVATRGGTCASPTVRLRIINSSSFAAFNITVDGHNMKVIAADAVPINPVNVGHIRINSGQRYDAMLCRTDGGYGEGAFWIRGQMDQDVFDSPSRHVEVLGILQYTKVLTTIPTSEYNPRGYSLGGRYTEQGYVIDPYGLSSNGPGIYPAPQPTVNITKTIIFRPEPSTNVTLGTFDNVPWMYSPPAGTPTLLQQVKSNSSVTFPVTAPVLRAKLNDVVMLILDNEDDGQHPMHLHGQDFYILARGKADAGKYNSSIPLNFKNPIMRDTATIDATSYIVLLFKADNPGIWLFHCHIDWHMSAGLALLMVVT